MAGAGERGAGEGERAGSQGKSELFQHEGNSGAGRRDFQRIFRLEFLHARRESARVAEDIASLRESLEVYRGLVEVSGLLTSITDSEELLRAILGVARRVTHAEAASLFLRSEDGAHLDLVIASQQEGHFVQPRIRVHYGQGIAGWVLEHGESQLVPDAYADRAFSAARTRTRAFARARSSARRSNGTTKSLAVLQVLNPIGKEAFEPRDLGGSRRIRTSSPPPSRKLRGIERIRQQERVQRDVAIAAEIQQELLSRAVPGEIPGAVFASYNKAAPRWAAIFSSSSRAVPARPVSRSATFPARAFPPRSSWRRRSARCVSSSARPAILPTCSPRSHDTLHDQNRARHVRDDARRAHAAGRTPRGSRERGALFARGTCARMGCLGKFRLPARCRSACSRRLFTARFPFDLAPGDFLMCYTDGSPNPAIRAPSSFFDERLGAVLQGALTARKPWWTVSSMKRRGTATARPRETT